MNFWKEIIPIFLIASIPQNFFFTWFSFVFLGQEHRLRKPKFRILMFSITLAVFSDLLFLEIPLNWHLLYSLFGFLSLILLFFRLIHWFDLVKIFIFFFISLFILDTVAEIISLNFITRDELLTNPTNIFFYTWPSLLLLWLSVYLMKKIQMFPGRTLFDFLKFRANKSITILLVFIFLQIMIITMLGISIFVEAQFKQLYSLFILLFITAILCFIVIFTALKLISQTKDDAVKMTQQLYLEDIDHMFSSIRGQRHDFLNHVQLMLTFLKQQKTSEAERYMQELVGEISEMNEIVRIDHPSLAAFVQTKVAEAINTRKSVLSIKSIILIRFRLDSSLLIL